jgi:integrase
MKNSYRNGMKVEPSLNTIHKYGVALRTIFKFAVQEKFITTEPIIETPTFKDERRPVFQRNEWRVLTNGMGKYVEDSRQANHYRDRYYLQHYILISSNCGARVGEIRELKWRDIRKEVINKRKVLYATVLGKTGEREMVFQPVCETYFDRLKTFRIDELGKSVPPQEHIFCKTDGSPIQSFRKSYDRLLKNLNLQFDNRGNKRTIYSLRHTYATFRLEDEVNPHLLARQMGTSVKMLEEHYGQTRGKLVAQQITKTSSQRTIPTSLVDELYSSKTDTE